jgi:hypothetical protein
MIKKVLFVFLLVFAGSQGKASLPEEFFSISSVVLLKSDSDEVTDIFGEAREIPLDYYFGQPIQTALCYQYPSDKQMAYLIFYFDNPEILRTVISYQLTLTQPNIECYSSKINLLKIRTLNGIMLGQKRNDFIKRFKNIDFKRIGEAIYYERENERASTDPGIEYWYEYSLIRAKFSNDALSEFLVERNIAYKRKK